MVRQALKQETTNKKKKKKIWDREARVLEEVWRWDENGVSEDLEFLYGEPGEATKYGTLPKNDMEIKDEIGWVQQHYIWQKIKGKAI